MLATPIKVNQNKIYLSNISSTAQQKSISHSTHFNLIFRAPQNMLPREHVSKGTCRVWKFSLFSSWFTYPLKIADFFSHWSVTRLDRMTFEFLSGSKLSYLHF